MIKQLTSIPWLGVLLPGVFWRCSFDPLFCPVWVQSDLAFHVMAYSKW